MAAVISIIPDVMVNRPLLPVSHLYLMSIRLISPVSHSSDVDEAIATFKLRLIDYALITINSCGNDYLVSEGTM